MIFTETHLKGAFIIELEKHYDERGYFARSWCREEFAAHGLRECMVQGNVSYNLSAGTLRGMHSQEKPFQEAKLVRCVRGAIFDAIIDLRSDSPTFRQWKGVELTELNNCMLYVPEGFAHGFQTLVDNTEVTYLVSELYTPGSERGVRYNDPAFTIKWPETPRRILSEKDSNWPDYIWHSLN